MRLAAAFARIVIKKRKMKGRIADFSADMLTGKQRLTITLDGDFRADFENLRDIDVEITVKPYRKKRSLNANAYMWQLIGKLADVLNRSPVDIYREEIKHIGVWQDVELTPKAAKTMRKSWEMHGIGWQSEQVDKTDDSVLIRFYYGSSVYDSKQMNRLISVVCEDCREQGIETMTPAELAALVDDWQKRKEKSNGTD